MRVQVANKITVLVHSVLERSQRLRGIADLIDVPALIRGLAIVVALFACAYLYTSMYAQKTIEALEARLASETVSIAAETANSHDGGDTHGRAHNGDDIHGIDGAEQDIPITLIEGLSAKSMHGLLPVIRPQDNLTSFRAYQAPFSFKGIGGKPVISFALNDFGLSVENSYHMLETLPPVVSFILSPYAKSPNKWIARAQEKGHEVWLSMPIQHEGALESGVNTIFHHASFADKKNTALSSLARGSGYVGVAAFTDDTLLYSRDHYFKLMDEFFGRGLGFLELNPDSSTVLGTKAFAEGAPYIKSNIEVFKSLDAHSFASLEKIAHKKGMAVAVVPSYPKTIDLLAQWIQRIGNVEYAIAPVSAIYDVPSSTHHNSSAPSSAPPAQHSNAGGHSSETGHDAHSPAH